MSRRSSRMSARSSRTSARTPPICMLKAIAIAMTVPRIHWASRLGIIDRLPHTCTTRRCPTTPRDPSPYARRYQPRQRHQCRRPHLFGAALRDPLLSAFFDPLLGPLSNLFRQHRAYLLQPRQRLGLPAPETPRQQHLCHPRPERLRQLLVTLLPQQTDQRPQQRRQPLPITTRLQRDQRRHQIAARRCRRSWLTWLAGSGAREAKSRAPLQSRAAKPCNRSSTMRGRENNCLYAGSSMAQPRNQIPAAHPDISPTSLQPAAPRSWNRTAHARYRRDHACPAPGRRPAPTTAASSTPASITRGIP